jgi:hypothetical protein
MKYLAKFVGLLILMGFLWSCNENSSTPIENLSSGEDTELSGTFLKPGETAQYEITLENLAPASGPGASQPLSPPVLVTHKPPLRLFKLNSFASEELRYIAEDAVNDPMLDLLSQSDDVFETVVGGLILPGTSATYTIAAKRGYHKLSTVTMLVNTNDGFTGVDKLNLPAKGSQVYYLRAYDAGTEQNTELAAHIPGPCCGNAMVRVATQERIQYHEGIQGSGDLDPQIYGWSEPVAKLTVKRVD